MNRKIQKRKKLIGCCCLFFGILFLSFVSYADQVNIQQGPVWRDDQKRVDNINSKEATIKKQDTEVGGVRVKTDNFPLSHYEPVISKPSTTDTLALTPAKMVFSLNRFVNDGLDTGIYFLSTPDILNAKLDELQPYVQSLWTSLIDNWLAILVVLMGLSVMFSYFIRFSFQESLKKVFKFVAVFVVASFLVMNGVTLIKMINDANTKLETTILGVVSPITGVTPNTDKNINGKDTVMSTLRNELFDTGVYQPYLMMNYGTTDVAQIKGGEKTVDNLLKYTQTKAGEDEKERETNKQATDNYYMSKNSSGASSKIGFSFFAIFATLAIGIPLLIISAISAIAQIMVILLFFILVISFFASLFPSLSDSWIKPFTGIIGALFMKVLAVVFAVLLFLVVQMVNTMISPTTVGRYACNTIFLAMLMNWLVKNRGAIVAMVISRDTSVMSQMFQGGRTKNHVQNVGRKAGKIATGAGGYVAGKAIQKKEDQTPKPTARIPIPTTHKDYSRPKISDPVRPNGYSRPQISDPVPTKETQGGRSSQGSLEHKRQSYRQDTGGYASHKRPRPPIKQLSPSRSYYRPEEEPKKNPFQSHPHELSRKRWDYTREDDERMKKKNEERIKLREQPPSRNPLSRFRKER